MAYRRTPAVEARLTASRERILAAALALVAQEGYAGCSVAAVARHGQVATGSVYRHFPNKASLVTEVFRTACQREIAAVAEAAGSPGRASERIAAMVETFCERALREPVLAYALLAEPVDIAVDAERLRFRRAFSGVFAQVIAEGMLFEELPEQDAEVTAAALVGAIAEALVAPLQSGRAAPDTVPSLTSFTLRAIGTY
ncbi:TetR/AcrR family transcriptional regulator [Allonocardiopsis opalescens]|uniref:TetR family transcriptional regulator n=1 Tax=Allonocardiopsis opalescens TaxID=1144618 RepID=A0A2T0PTZ2_9ACTN|nr:TetR/AcrR family transcriptional regulator [Allonocardiopsis opalescens]PRX92370.1 TetR family transcriptional regulator [Allonocardiopsis opalescens]